MITWIQVLLQKHHKVVFTILLGVIIIAFVFTIGSGVPFFGDGQARRIERQDVFGYNLQDPATANFVQRQAQIELMLKGGRGNEQMLEFAMIRYAFLSNMAEKLGIRTLGQDDLANYMRSLPALQNADGTINVDQWKQFTAYLSISESELERIMTRNAIAAKVEQLIAGPGYALAGSVEDAYKSAFGKWDVEIASLSFESFNPEIPVDEAKLKEFFNANQEAFRVPAAVAFDVAFFPAPAAKDVAFDDEALRTHYTKTVGKYVIQVDGQYTIKEFEDVKAEVAQDLKKASAVQEALFLADDTATKIYEANAEYGSDAVKKILADAKAQIKQLPLVRPNDATFPEGIPTEAFKAGFNLGKQNYYSDPVPAEDGAWLVFFRDTRPSFIPEFEGMKDAVERMYKHSEKQRLFAEKGKAAEASLNAALKGGKKFEDAAKAEGFTVSAITAFSFSDNSFRTQEMLVYLQILSSELPKMNAGDISPMITRTSGGYIVHAAAFNAPAIDQNSEEFQNFANFVRNESLRNSTYSILSAALTPFMSRPEQD